ncbi:MAG: hypothetical protein ABTQ34_08730 [Bdellovibrionales bacterium]
MMPDSDLLEKYRKTNTKWALCLVALAAGLIASGTTWVYNQADKPIGKYDAMELEALTLYIAREKKINEADLRLKIESRFDVRHYTELTSLEGMLAKRELEAMAP